MRFAIVICTDIFFFVILFIVTECTYLNQTKSNQDFCTIQTKSGKIRGQLNWTLFENTRFYSFRGVPFAKPPIGKFRFKVSITKFI